MTVRMLQGFGLIAGLTLPEMWKLKPGFIMDMFLARQRYDDQQHGIKRGREVDA